MDINVYFMIAWAIVFLLAIGIEFATSELVSIWFAVGAFGAFFFCIPNNKTLPFYVSIIVFFVISTIFLVIFKVIFKKKLDSKNYATNYQSLVGQEVTIYEMIDENKGLCKIGDVVWTCSSSEVIHAGEKVTISDIQGNRLIVLSKGETK